MLQNIRSSSRRLADTTFVPSSTMSLLVPKDVVARWLNLELHGSIVTTFASGSPAAPRESTIDTLIPTLNLTIDGQTVKAVRPHMLHMLEIIAYGQEGQRKSSVGAATIALDNPTVDGGFAWGTTTQTTTVRETVQIPFEMILANVGQEGTWLDTRGASNCFLQMLSGPYSGLDTTGAPVTFSASTFVIEAYLEVVAGVAPNESFGIFSQIWSQENISSQVTEKYYEMAFGQFIAGYGLYVKNGASPSVPTDVGLTDIKIYAGDKVIKQTTFQAVQAEMRQIYSCNTPRTANVSRTDGFVYIPTLTQDRNLFTAFDARNLTSVRLVISSTTSGNVTYPLQVNIEQHQIVKKSRAN